MTDEPTHRIEWTQTFQRVGDYTERHMRALIEPPHDREPNFAAAVEAKLAEIDAKREASKTMRDRAADRLRALGYDADSREDILDGLAGLLAPDEPDWLAATNGPKALRETLCGAQGAILRAESYDEQRRQWDADRISKLIEVIDWHRPLGPNGKHGLSRCTPTCGCEDKRAITSDKPPKLLIDYLADEGYSTSDLRWNAVYSNASIKALAARALAEAEAAGREL